LFKAVAIGEALKSAAKDLGMGIVVGRSRVLADVENPVFAPPEV
jgi:hypothetical protein